MNYYEVLTSRNQLAKLMGWVGAFIAMMISIPFINKAGLTGLSAIGIGIVYAMIGFVAGYCFG